MLIQGSEMETVATRKRFGFVTRFRLCIRGFGVYGKNRVFDTEEVVVATRSLSFADYLEARRHHTVCIDFWNQDWVADAIRFAAAHGIKPSACMGRSPRPWRGQTGPLPPSSRASGGRPRGSSSPAARPVWTSTPRTPTSAACTAGRSATTS